MKNSEYWKLCFAQLEEAQNELAETSCKEIERQYRQAVREIEGKIDTWYRQLGVKGISMAEARKPLSASELANFKLDVHDYIKYGKENGLSGQWIKQLENVSDKLRISKYDALRIHTQQSLESLFAKQTNIVSAAMKEVYQSGYYHTAFEVQKGFGVGWDILGIDQNQLEKVIAKPWAVDGKNFSERIWSNKQRVIAEVNNELTKNILLGADPKRAIDSIAGKLNACKSGAGRLVMTEGAYFGSAAQKDCFEELGVEEYEVVATLDRHTSEICRSLDGKRFPVKEFRVGVTAPPFHPWCRSTVCPCFDDDFGERTESYCIPEDMSYEEWNKRFVDGGDKTGLAVVDKSGNGGIIKEKLSKSVKIPDDCTYLISKDTNFDDKNISEDILKTIDKTIRERLSENKDFVFDEIKIAKFRDTDKSVFITNLEVLGGQKKARFFLIVIFSTIKH